MNENPLAQIRAEVQWRRDGESPGWLFDPRTGGVFGLNNTAATILESLASGRDQEGLVEDMVAGFEVDELTARQDVSAFLGGLKEQDLVEG